MYTQRDSIRQNIRYRFGIRDSNSEADAKKMAMKIIAEHIKDDNSADYCGKDSFGTSLDPTKLGPNQKVYCLERAVKDALKKRETATGDKKAFYHNVFNFNLSHIGWLIVLTQIDGCEFVSIDYECMLLERVLRDIRQAGINNLEESKIYNSILEKQGMLSNISNSARLILCMDIMYKDGKLRDDVYICEAAEFFEGSNIYANIFNNKSDLIPHIYADKHFIIIENDCGLLIITDTCYLKMEIANELFPKNKILPFMQKNSKYQLKHIQKVQICNFNQVFINGKLFKYKGKEYFSCVRKLHNGYIRIDLDEWRSILLTNDGEFFTHSLGKEFVFIFQNDDDSIWLKSTARTEMIIEPNGILFGNDGKVEFGMAKRNKDGSTTIQHISNNTFEFLTKLILCGVATKITFTITHNYFVNFIVFWLSFYAALITTKDSLLPEITVQKN
jgi:hypothetical protein